MADPAGTQDPEAKGGDEASHAVRFASVDETKTIEPEESQQSKPANVDIPADQQTRLEQLSSSFQSSHLQERRMSAFAFEPVSLPASRTTSNQDSSLDASRHSTHGSSGRPSPRQRPHTSSMHSPPITPAATRSRDAQDEGVTKAKVETEQIPAAVATQISPPATSPSTTNIDESRPGSSGEMATRPTSEFAGSGEGQPKHHGAFSIGPGTHDSSVSTSRDQSPSRTSAAPPIPVYSRPFTPGGDANDPYAANKRPPQPKNFDSIDPRFKFTAIGSKHRQTASSSSVSLPRSSRSTADSSIMDERHSMFSSGPKENLSRKHDECSSTTQSKHGSMSELKRFLKFGNHHKSKRAASPTPSAKSGKSGTRTPPSQRGVPQQLPFGDDHGLSARYGKFGKVLGAGAGGSVRLMKRSGDGTTFAVKEFRARHSYETEKEYAKKVTAEFCVGSTLHHGNIIETLDIVQEKGKWYEVMEYAPYDLFAIVMTGKMSREEITCSFLQILSGVTYLHSMGLAHRDLKLDNVVVNDQGIMKIIDFGSASVFKYPFENGTTLSSGIVGSDPYLAPEVYDERKYDPQPADIWSLAIIYCCMSLRRFPWKMPRVTDNSYKLFASPPTPGTDIRRDSQESSTASRSTVAVDSQDPSTGASQDGEKKAEVIKGPWRLLRLLPRESRHIIGRMLELDPKKRATLAEVLEDPWVSNTVICQQEENGRVIKTEGHTHTLEPPATQAPTK